MTVPGGLAIDGATPVRRTPMPPWPCPDGTDLAAVAHVMRSGRMNYWTGDEGRQLESEYAASVGRTHGVAVANGTLALELALRALQIGPGDEVVVPARTFIATASSVVALGATPVVADIDADSGNITAQAMAAVLSERTRAVVPVHLGGWPVDMDPIIELAHARGILVIEDCAQAAGGLLDGRPVGNLGSDAAAFSFCQDKIVPAGEGGLLVLDDDDAFERAWAYKDHGKSLRKLNDPEFMAAETPFKFLVDSFGSNWRIHELAAAIARVGLGKLPIWHAERTAHAHYLAEQLRGVAGLRVPLPGDGVSHAFYRLYAHVRPEMLAEGWSRDRILAAIKAEGAPCQYGTCAEIYREPAMIEAGFAPASPLPVASEAHATSLAFYVHPGLKSGDIDDTAAAVRKVMEVATR